MISISGALIRREDRLDAHPAQLELRRPGIASLVEHAEVPLRSRSNSAPYWVHARCPCSTTTWLRLFPAARGAAAVFFPVSVRVKLVEPVSTAALVRPGSRTTNFWWKIAGFRSATTSTPARWSAL